MPSQIVALPAWLVVLLVGNLLGIIGNVAISVWWASKINAWLNDVREEIREKIRPTLHDHANDITEHNFKIRFLEESLVALRRELKGD